MCSEVDVEMSPNLLLCRRFHTYTCRAGHIYLLHIEITSSRKRVRSPLRIAEGEYCPNNGHLANREKDTFTDIDYHLRRDARILALDPTNREGVLDTLACTGLKLAQKWFSQLRPRLVLSDTRGSGECASSPRTALHRIPR
jgi:hypothetical protein